MVALDMVPNFFAITPEAEFEIEDLEYLFRQSSISREELEIYAAIEENGVIDTITLWKQVHQITACPRGRFNRALLLLQKNLLVIADGIAEAGRWKYAYEYRHVKDVFPEQLKKAVRIRPDKARQKIILAILASNGANASNEIKKILQWENILIEQTLQKLIQSNQIVYALSEKGDNIFALPEMI